MIERRKQLKRLDWLLRHFPVVAIVGPRQVGKTTLAHALASQRKGRTVRFDLEDPTDRARLVDSMLALEPLRGLVVLDEIQRRPDLFPVLRVLADRPRTPARFLVLGSAAPDLLRQSSESLAGRIAYQELLGLSLEDVGEKRLDALWRRGGFPRSFLARTEAASYEWRREFIRTFLERDVPQLGIALSAPTLERFWSMLAHYHAQIWNASELGRAFGVADTTVRGYLDALTATFMVRQLRPWHENLGKRQVKAPKIYLSDTGLLHSLLGVTDQEDLERHPKVGASWEGFAMVEVIKHLGARDEECFFWATHQGAELDLFVKRGRVRLGFEFKRSSAPSLTRSMHIALTDLKLDQLNVIHAGRDAFPMANRVRAIPLRRVRSELRALR